MGAGARRSPVCAGGIIGLLETLSNQVIPATLAFDDSGDLWYADLTHSTIGEFTPSQLTTSGSPTPTVAIAYAATPSFAGTGIAFDPHATGVPLH